MRRLPLSLLLCLAACLPNVGPTTVPAAREGYNAYIASSNVQQLLLNIVRLRYRDVPYFLEVAGVLTQYEVAGQASVGELGWRDVDGFSGFLGASAQVAERPTITYQPLAGEAFVRRMLSPIPVAAFNLLAGTGWSIERLMLCCLDEVNGARNAPGASGPSPTVLYDDPRFREAARVMRQLQLTGIVEFLRPTDSTPTGRIRLHRDRVQSADDSAAYRRLVEGLELRRSQLEFTITAASDTSSTSLHIYQRSTLATMFYLAHGVDIPEEHVRKGYVTVTRSPAGAPIDWQEVMGGIFRVRTGPDRPDHAYVAVRHRDHWFWIADEDLETKTTMGLLGFLLALQSVGTPQGVTPLLTVPTGR